MRHPDRRTGFRQSAPTLPELAEYTARQFAGEVTDEFSDDQAYELAWAALLRLLDRIDPEYKN
ncbi:hypothetical protein GCM10020255_018460 [Rhodococcus baikonurensis]